MNVATEDVIEVLDRTNLLDRAICFASISHLGQLDKGGKPYILHPLRVMLSLKDESEAVQVTAVLHDVIEDCGVTKEEIEHEFGTEIAEAVYSVSRIEEPVKETYVNFCTRSKANKIGRIVKIADLRDNMSPERHNALPESEKGIMNRYVKALAFMQED
jgi:(p)ppGpp synthase/HD superfamily hydrolase